MNRSRFEDIVKIYEFTERELHKKFLIQLDWLNIIELQPLNRVCLLVSRHFSWRAGVPVQHYLHHKRSESFLQHLLWQSATKDCLPHRLRVHYHHAISST